MLIIGEGVYVLSESNHRRISIVVWRIFNAMHNERNRVFIFSTAFISEVSLEAFERVHEKTAWSNALIRHLGVCMPKMNSAPRVEKAIDECATNFGALPNSELFEFQFWGRALDEISRQVNCATAAVAD